MMGRSPSFLGLAFSDTGAACAEVAPGGGGRGTLRRTATFTFAPDATLDKPDAAGAALAAFLKQHKFGASRVVVGVPARWLIAVERDVPPADEELTRATLRLQAERLAVAESGELIFDYAGKGDPSAATKVLLVGMRRERLARIETMTRAAGLTLAGVTSTGLTLASTAIVDGGGVLVLGRGGGEIVFGGGGSPRMLRHVAVTTNGHGHPPLAPLGAELRRAVALARTNGEPGDRGLLLMDGVGLEPHHVAELSEKSGVSVRSAGEDEVLGAATAVESPAVAALPGQFAPAAALALAGARGVTLPVDFTHSRLAPEPKSRFGRARVWAAILGVILIGGLLALYLVVRHRESQLAAINAGLKDKQPAITTAKTAIDRLSYARGFFDNRPPMLDGLRELTLVFRDDERVWVNSFTLRENGKGQISGNAADQKAVLALLGRLSGSDRFTDVKLLDMREADARSKEISFSISFGLNRLEVTP
jgi:hypothetical protein